jgi:lipopolysaccharide export system protein LptC
VDTPTVTGTDGSGTLYSATARLAKVRLGTTDVVDMEDAEFTMTPKQGAAFSALAPSGVLQVEQQTIAVPGTLTVSSADGMRGTLDDFFGDFATWWLEAHGAVDLTFPGGMRVQSQGMNYDGNIETWTFERVTVTLKQTPGATP